MSQEEIRAQMLTTTKETDNVFKVFTAGDCCDEKYKICNGEKV